MTSIINNKIRYAIMKIGLDRTYPDKKLETDIAKLIAKSDHPEDPRHSVLTKKWLLKLDPQAPYYIQIAALAHDIDRAINKAVWYKNRDPYNDFKRRHQNRSAKIISDLLKKHNYPLTFRRKVSHIVKNHEFGGDPESDLVKHADSLSFFENNIKHMMKRHPDSYTIKKCKWMYKRCDKKTRELIRKIKQPKKIAGLLKKVF